MALVFVDTRDLEAAVAIREAAESDGHEVVMVDSAREIENRLTDRGEAALVLTAELEGPVSGQMITLFA